MRDFSPQKSIFFLISICYRMPNSINQTGKIAIITILLQPYFFALTRPLEAIYHQYGGANVKMASCPNVAAQNSKTGPNGQLSPIS